MKNNKKTVICIIAVLLMVSFLNIFNTSTAEEKTYSSSFCEDVEKNIDDYSILLEKQVSTGQEVVMWQEEVDVYLNQVVDFRLKLTNNGKPGTHPIMYEHVEDFLPENLEYIPGSANIPPTKYSDHYVEWKLEQCLKVGESFNIIFSAKAVLEGTSENFAKVDCCNEFHWPQDNDTANVNIISSCEPGISIDKKVLNECGWSESTEVNLGDTVHFKVIIDNPSECYLIHFSGVVFDQLPNNLRYVNGSSTIYDEAGWPNVEEVDWENNIVYWYKPPSIPPGENLTFFYNATAVDCGIGENNITAHPEGFTPVDHPGGEVSNADGSYDVSDQTSIYVDCDQSGISIDKQADCEEVCIGETVEYTYYVSNTGTVDLTNIVVTDNKISEVEYESGDTNSNGLLELDETWVYTASATLCENTTNIGTVTGEDEYGEIVTDEDIVTVKVIDCSCDPEISVDKKIKYNNEWSNDLTVEGYPVDVTFKITVENTGTCELFDIEINDNVGCGIDNFHDFSIIPDYVDDYHIEWIYNEILSPGEKIIILFNATVNFDTSNNVVVSGYSTYDNTAVDDEDTVSITATSTENHKPNKPIYPEPENYENNVETSPVLSVYVTDPDLDSMTVTFHDASDDSVIDVIYNAESGTRVSTAWYNLEYETTYKWYAKADDQEFTNTSNTWTFETEKEEQETYDPEIKIEQPTNGIYFSNSKLLNLPGLTLIIGPIDIQVNASDEDGTIEKVEFLIDNVSRYNETSGKNNWTWNERIFGRHTIKVRAYDNDDNIAEDKIQVIIFNLAL